MKKLLLLISIILMPLMVKAEDVTLEKCVDGDTAKFLFNEEIITARFLAIDTPETVKKGTSVEPYGKEASKYSCDSLTNTNSIRIEYDLNSDKLDKYERHLVWVFVDNKLLQEEILNKGLGKIKYVYGDYKYLDNLKKIESIARINKVGIWNEQDNISYLKYIVGLILTVIVIIVAVFIPKKYSKVNKYVKQIKKAIK